jgi:Kef-type K+ transport system membrane component KefB
MTGYAIGSVTVGAILTRYPVEDKARASMLAWILYLPAYGLFATGHNFPLAVVGAFVAGIAEGTARILLTSAAQEQIPNDVLGRVMGVISLVHRGAHATGLLLISPLFAVFAPRAIFAGAALAIPAAGIVGAVLAYMGEKRRRAARAVEI